MPRRASRGTGPKRDPIGTDHTPWPGSPQPVSSWSAAIQPGRRGALHECHGQVDTAPRHRRARRRGSGVRTPGRDRHGSSPTRTQSRSTSHSSCTTSRRGRLGVDPVELGEHPVAQLGLVGALGQRVGVELDDRPAVLVAPARRVVLEPLEHRDVVERVRSRSCRGTAARSGATLPDIHSRHTAKAGADRMPATRSRHAAPAASAPAEPVGGGDDTHAGPTGSRASTTASARVSRAAGAAGGRVRDDEAAVGRPHRRDLTPGVHGRRRGAARWRPRGAQSVAS